ncbi:chloramphenicol acetyltransferase [Pontibacter sp. JH31]|uniref:Chloramphenicol acetyltransferase n=1 Tax=Pontibacter aquaedesilientis TaxID=2766980 RepID=A0ABR7XE97_9BACT|nr:CatA-like O-acetyltransferase [Pontibacter aquaedesilientis]MBD1395696.1 chloramphenicol acetyltransferase [Pontibacter aquaedesilientis]
MQTRYTKQIIPLDGWEREETFRFFSTFTQPFFNVHTEVEITPLYRYCKQHGLSVSLAYMHATTQAARASENLLLRIENGQVVRFSGLDLSTTILKDNQQIAFTHFPYQEKLEDFCEEGAEIIASVKKSKKLFNGHQGIDLLHMTTLPWFTFKGMEHAFSIGQEDPGVPKIGYGKLEMRDEKVYLPMSIGLHHALADGYHMHLFLEELGNVIKDYSC